MKPCISGHGRRCLRATIAGAVFCVVTSALAQDRAEIDRAQIIGNRELPKVIYIVPWKKPLPGDLSSRPLESVIDEAMAPVDRDVFRRQVRYEAQLLERAGAGSNAEQAASRK